MTKSSTIPLAGLAALAGRYDVILSDVWGVIHNGVNAWESATQALTRYREAGGTVVLVSNAPRPAEGVVPQLDQIGVPRSAWDALITSGDMTAAEILRRGVTRIHHIGPARDNNLFDAVERVGVEEAELAIVTGLDDDEVEGPEDYRERLEAVRARDLDLVCANPDRVVERGDRLIWCAGALADLYAELGGRVLFMGKPYEPIYAAALALGETVRRAKVPRERVLALGDSVRTDLAGANTFGVDCLFLTGGIHGAEIGHPPVPDRFDALLAEAERHPIGWSHRLAWEH